MAFEPTPDIAGRPFRDLRSARRAANRQRKHKAKYNNFRQIKPSDLPSHPNQQPHLLPNCIHPSCDTYGTVDNCPVSVFPADLSTATSANFTKRGAYEEVKGWRNAAPRHHHSRVKKDLPTHQTQKIAKHMNTNEAHTRNGDWIEDLDWYDYVDLQFYHDAWRDWDDEYWHYWFCDEEEENEEDDEGYYSDNDGKREFAGDVEWNWHRLLFDGQWYATKWRCQRLWCACEEFKEKEREEREAMDGKAEAELDLDDFEEEYEKDCFDECDLCDKVRLGVVPSDTESEAGADWDVVSNASEAWSEIDEDDSDIATW